jgi:acid phosphatase
MSAADGQASIPMRRRPVLLALVVGLVAAAVLASCGRAGEATSMRGGPAVPLPHFDHVVVVVEENHSYAEILGSADAPYINSLARSAAVFTDSHGIGHPSQPNYLTLFAGSTFGVTGDECPQQFHAPNLGGELIGHGLSFAGYSEGLPRAGYTGCDDGNAFDPLYARKHNPWVDFADVPADANLPFSSFPADFRALPTLAFVVPNQLDDMHSGSVAAGDAWLNAHLDAYARWAPAHNSLLIITWDEDDTSSANHVATLFVGAHVRPGQYPETINHYDVLRTIEALYGLPFSGHAATAMTIADVWQS